MRVHYWPHPAAGDGESGSDRVRDVFEALPAAQREAIALHLADLPIHEVAETTGSPVGTVKSRLSRGRATLAALLADLPETSDETRHG